MQVPNVRDDPIRGMKSIVPILIAECLCAANALAQNQSLSQPSTLNSLSRRSEAKADQPSSTNRVLELDGNGSCVELPPNIFNDFEIELRQ